MIARTMNTRTALVTARAAARSSGVTAHSITRAKVAADQSEMPKLFVDTSTNWSIFRMAAASLATYHGYRRNNSIGWGIGWFLLGSAFPIPTMGIAFGQGFGKKAGT